jgi:hypothetical protein
MWSVEARFSSNYYINLIEEAIDLLTDAAKFDESREQSEK